MKKIIVLLILVSFQLYGQTTYEQLNEMYKQSKFFDASKEIPAFSQANIKDFKSQILCGDIYYELEEYKKAIDHATIVSKANPKGVITYVNDKFCTISGYSPEELIGQNHNIVRSPHMQKEVFKDLWNTIQNKQTWSGVVENRAKNGESYFVQAMQVD